MTDKANRYRTMRETLGPDHPDTKEAFAARLDEALAAEFAVAEPGLWWLSFTDPERPAGQQFLGVIVVEAVGTIHATSVTHALGINPGGAIATWGPLPPGSISPEWRNRLLTREEAESIPEPS